MLVSIASRMPLSGAADALRRIEEVLASERFFYDEWVLSCRRARLLAGDVVFLALFDPFDLHALFALSKRDEYDDRREAQTWIRTLCDDVSSRLWEIALGRLDAFWFDAET